MSKEANYKREEKLNAISHGLGALLAIIGFFFLLAQNGHKSPYATLGIVLYGVTLISMFLVSTIYHAFHKAHFNHRLRILDHINIYFLIAGTYSPVALITLEEGNGWTIFYTVWAIAALGTLLKLFFTGRFEVVSLSLYLIMGWLIVLDFRNLMDHTSQLGLRLLFTGGAFYTLGIVFYAWRRIPYNHFIWHLFVLGGAMSHWFYIYFAVV